MRRTHSMVGIAVSAAFLMGCGSAAILPQTAGLAAGEVGRLERQLQRKIHRETAFLEDSMDAALRSRAEARRADLERSLERTARAIATQTAQGAVKEEDLTGMLRQEVETRRAWFCQSDGCTGDSAGARFAALLASLRENTTLPEAQMSSYAVLRNKLQSLARRRPAKEMLRFLVAYAQATRQAADNPDNPPPQER